jgi:hypothetical protein
MRATFQTIREKLRKKMHLSLGEVGRWLRRVVQGWLNYHAVPGNSERIGRFVDEIVRFGGGSGASQCPVPTSIRNRLRPRFRSGRRCPPASLYLSLHPSRKRFHEGEDRLGIRPGSSNPALHVTGEVQGEHRLELTDVGHAVMIVIGMVVRPRKDAAGFGAVFGALVGEPGGRCGVKMDVERMGDGLELAGEERGVVPVAGGLVGGRVPIRDGFSGADEIGLDCGRDIRQDACEGVECGLGHVLGLADVGGAEVVFVGAGDHGRNTIRPPGGKIATDGRTHDEDRNGNEELGKALWQEMHGARWVHWYRLETEASDRHRPPLQPLIGKCPWRCRLGERR